MPDDIAILLDMDGTLVDTEPAGFAAVERAFLEVAQVTIDRMDRWFGRSESEFFSAVAEAHGVSDVDAVIQRFYELYLPSLDGAQPLPGVMQAMEQLATLGPMVVVSGSTRGQIERVTSAIGLRHQLVDIFGCEDYQRGKPHPEPYQLAAQSLGYTPERCLVFEDSDAGVASGREAGMKVVGLRVGNPVGRYHLNDAHLVLESFEEFTLGHARELVGA